jgi:surface polysaccharide O-acyltransferase-like enzyme
MEQRKRSERLDLIRSVAVLSVIAVHFCLNNQYYNRIIEGKVMLFMTYLRTGFMICVPLFMMLTGYLLNQKKLELSFYKKAWKILFVYITASVLCVLYQILFMDVVYPAKDMLFAFLGFSAAPYGWYLEMYFGLFFLAPFLNLIYWNLKNKKQKQWLVILLLILTVLPTVTNIFDFYTPGAIKNPLLTNGYQQILPDYWVGLYPVMYYFLGAYISEFPVKIKKRVSLPLYFLLLLFFGTFIYWKNYGRTFEWGIYSEWNSLATLSLTFVSFIFLLAIPVEKAGASVKKLLYQISKLSLGIYLTSWILDQAIYPVLEQKIPSLSVRILLFVPTVFVVFLGAFIGSAMIEGLYTILKGWRKKSSEVSN